MDFGISRVIEMFEERFGRKATTALVGLIALALACGSVKIIVEVLVIPTYNITLEIVSIGIFSSARLWISSITRTQVFATVQWSILAAAFTWIYFKTVQRHAIANLRKDIKQNPNKYTDPILAVVREKLITNPQGVILGVLEPPDKPTEK